MLSPPPTRQRMPPNILSLARTCIRVVRAFITPAPLPRRRAVHRAAHIYLLRLLHPASVPLSTACYLPLYHNTLPLLFRHPLTHTNHLTSCLPTTYRHSPRLLYRLPPQPAIPRNRRVMTCYNRRHMPCRLPILTPRSPTVATLFCLTGREPTNVTAVGYAPVVNS